MTLEQASAAVDTTSGEASDDDVGDKAAAHTFNLMGI